MFKREAPHMRGECSRGAGTCGCANFLTDMSSGCSPYARAYVVAAGYENCAADPEAALMQGTYFNNLYMPFVQQDMMKWSCGCEKED